MSLTAEGVDSATSTLQKRIHRPQHVKLEWRLGRVVAPFMILHFHRDVEYEVVAADATAAQAIEVAITPATSAEFVADLKTALVRTSIIRWLTYRSRDGRGEIIKDSTFAMRVAFSGCGDCGGAVVKRRFCGRGCAYHSPECDPCERSITLFSRRGEWPCNPIVVWSALVSMQCVVALVHCRPNYKVPRQVKNAKNVCLQSVRVCVSSQSMCIQPASTLKNQNSLQNHSEFCFVFHVGERLDMAGSIENYKRYN